MKFRITFKDPDGVWSCLKDAGIDPNEIEQDVEDTLRKFILYREVITVEFDTESKTAEVIPP